MCLLFVINFQNTLMIVSAKIIKFKIFKTYVVPNFSIQVKKLLKMKLQNFRIFSKLLCHNKSKECIKGMNYIQVNSFIFKFDYISI